MIGSALTGWKLSAPAKPWCQTQSRLLAKDIPSKRGLDNTTKSLSYYRDENALFEAFKKGLVDVFIEENSGRLTTDYDFPAVARRGGRETFETELRTAHVRFRMNSGVRLQDPACAGADQPVRLEWAKPHLLSDAYTRTRAFDNSELSSHGRPPPGGKGAAGALPRCGFARNHAGGWQPPSRTQRAVTGAFLKIGFDRRKQRLRCQGRPLTGPYGVPLSFEIMSRARKTNSLRRLAADLAAVGIEFRFRQWTPRNGSKRLIGYDYDVIPFNYTSRCRRAWNSGALGSVSRDAPAAFNFAGVASRPSTR